MAAGRMSESTEALLDAFNVDLQRQLRHAGIVERLVADEADGGQVTLTAQVRVAAQTVELTGTGENLLTAYASLTRANPELILGSAYRQVLDRAIGS
jgi:hypothetical protein